MKDLRGRVAVVTGAASGIGRGLAERFSQEGMKVVLADIEQRALLATEAELRAQGGDVLAVLTDVSEHADVAALAQRTLDAYGAVHVVCNNAGVAVIRTIWTMSQKDWEWTWRVNVDGVINGIRTFIPIMMRQNEGYMINTSSIIGLSTANFGPYSVTKHAVVACSEALHHGLVGEGSSVRVSVLCPGFVRTRLLEAERNRQPRYRDPAPEGLPPRLAGVKEALAQAMENGMEPREVADQVIEAMAQERFYVLTHPEANPLIQLRADDVLHGRKPTALS